MIAGQGNDMQRPFIGITGDYALRDPGEQFSLNADYFDAVEKAGGVPVLLPPVRNDEALRALLQSVGALLIPGGQDAPPARYGQKPHAKTKPVHERRDEFDFRCIAAAINVGLPVMAICYGAQLLNVFFGGTLVQDIVSQKQIEECHARIGRERSRHPARIEPGTKLARILGVDELEVNSSHHQAVDAVGPALRVSARSPAGIVEGIETDDDRLIIGVQWHPEELIERREHMLVFEALIAAAH